jgi:CHRD domain
VKAFVSAALAAAVLIVGTMAPSSAKQVVVKLNAVGGSGEMGRAVLTDVPAAAPVVRVSITVSGEPPAAVQPSHIHKGVCGSNGPIVKPLHNVVSGASVTMVPGVTVAQLIATGTYINIHKSAQQIPVIVSCGMIM